MGNESRDRSARDFNKFVTRDANNSLKIDRSADVLINDSKKQYEDYKKLYLETTSLAIKTIEQITKLYTDQNGNILKQKITPDTKNLLLQQLEDARLNLIIA
jgi:hypothetical protein